MEDRSLDGWAKIILGDKYGKKKKEEVMEDIISISKKTGKKALPCINMVRRENIVLCKKTELTCVVLMELSKITSTINTNYIFLDDVKRCPGAKIKKEFKKKKAPGGEHLKHPVSTNKYRRIEK